MPGHNKMDLIVKKANQILISLRIKSSLKQKFKMHLDLLYYAT